MSGYRDSLVRSTSQQHRPLNSLPGPKPLNNREPLSTTTKHKKPLIHKSISSVYIYSVPGTSMAIYLPILQTGGPFAGEQCHSKSSRKVPGPVGSPRKGSKGTAAGRSDPTNRSRASQRLCNTVGGMLAPLGLAGESASWQGNNNEPGDTERSQRAVEAL